jgi:CubicO group peptidase (beta-lactamase class C family)
MQTRWLCLLTVTFCSSVALAADVQVSAESIRRAADDLLLPLHERGLFNGAVVLARDGAEVYARGFGAANVAAGVMFTPDTPVDGGSVAKPFTAMAVHLLLAEDKLRLDDPVQRHLPEYPHAQTRVRHLISHCAGLPGYEFFEPLIPAGEPLTTPRFLDIIRKRRITPAFTPGTRFSYDNIAFDTAALLVERVSGERWDAFLRKRVFAPLRMDSIFLRPVRLADWKGIRTLSYRRDGGALVLHDVFDNEGFYGGGNLYVSARELARWSESFYLRPVLDKRRLAAGYEAPVLRDQRTGEGGSSGINLLSWYDSERGHRYHYPGSHQGFWNSAYRDEDRRYSVVYVSNNSIPQWLRPLLTRALIGTMEGRTPGPVDMPAFANVRREDLRSIAGTFLVEGVGTARIAERDRQLYLRIEDGLEYPAYPVTDGQVYVPGLDLWIGFPVADTPFRRITWLSIFHVAEGRRIR